MSVPELLYRISSPEGAFQDYLRRVNILIDELRSNLTKSIEELRSDLNKVDGRMVAKLQNFNLQMKPQAAPVSDLSISKVNFQNIWISADIATDIDTFQGITWVFRKIPIFNLKNHAFKLKHGLSHPSVLTLNLTSPNLPLGRLSSQPKPSLPSLTHQVLENQHIWPSWTIYTKSCPYPGKVLRQQVLINMY